MPSPHASLLLSIAAVALALSPDARAFDPFDTAAAIPPRPALNGATAENNPRPCDPPRAGSPLNVTDAVDLALCKNPQTREIWANARAQAALVGVAQSAYLPSLDGKAATSRVTSNAIETRQRSTSLTLSWLLFDFGARAANLENARQLLEAASATLDSTVQTVFLSALQSYYAAQATRAALTAAQESEKASRESFSAAEARYRIGTGTPADRLQAQTAWSQATLNRIKTEGEVRNSLGTLANVMGLDANQPLLLADIAAVSPDIASERDVDALIEEARQRRPDLKSAEAQYKAAQYNIDYTRNSGLPTLSLGTGPTWQETSGTSSTVTTNGNTIGFTVNVPIFSGFSTTYKVRNAEAQAEAKAAQRDRIRLQVALDVWKAYQNLATANQSIKTTIDLLASAEQSERVALGRYKAGVGNILDVLNAQTALASARLQRVQATFDWYVYRATLAQAIGALDNGLLQASGSGKQQP
jgi:TolC family type I secretion outer membrane protein